MRGGALFDRVVVVDWSAASEPKRGRDSIWMATIDGENRAIENVATRRECEERLAGLLADDGQHRTLLGVDFSLGYPEGTAAGLGLTGTPWRALWELLETEIDDDARNANNRFAVAGELNRRLGAGPGPFWGRPRGQVVESLSTTKPSTTKPTTTQPAGTVTAEWRAVESMLRLQGWRPFSSWQLLGAGCVGSQSLVGIPVLERLRRKGGDRLHVWPFTTGLAAPVVEPGDLVVAEVWPTLVDVEPYVPRHRVRDAAQVAALAERLAGLDRLGLLAEHFAPAVDRRVTRSVIAEEGWILGATDGAMRGREAGAPPAAAMATTGS